MLQSQKTKTNKIAHDDLTTTPTGQTAVWRFNTVTQKPRRQHVHD